MHSPFTHRGFAPQREDSAALSARDFGCSATACGSHSPSEDTAPPPSHPRVLLRERNPSPLWLTAGAGVHHHHFWLRDWFLNPFLNSLRVGNPNSSTVVHLLPKPYPFQRTRQLHTQVAFQPHRPDDEDEHLPPDQPPNPLDFQPVFLSLV